MELTGDPIVVVRPINGEIRVSIERFSVESNGAELVEVERLGTFTKGEGEAAWELTKRTAEAKGYPVRFVFMAVEFNTQAKG